jgi:hypothetical protein
LSDSPSIGQRAVGVDNSGTPVRAAIARAAQATGVDFSYLLAQAKIESSLNPSAKAPTSSAAGLYQFTNGTWLETLDRHGAEHGLGWAGDAISAGRVTDPAMRAQIMALRYDANTAALMAGELAADNRAELATALGEPRHLLRRRRSAQRSRRDGPHPRPRERCDGEWRRRTMGVGVSLTARTGNRSVLRRTHRRTDRARIPLCSGADAGHFDPVDGRNAQCLVWR